jgi:hypothetical protein
MRCAGPTRFWPVLAEHQKTSRIKARILVCFLGYALWKMLQQWQSRAGLGDSPRTILTELSRITAAQARQAVAPSTSASGLSKLRFQDSCCPLVCAA